MRDALKQLKVLLDGVSSLEEWSKSNNYLLDTEIEGILFQLSSAITKIENDTEQKVQEHNSHDYSEVDQSL